MKNILTFWVWLVWTIFVYYLGSLLIGGLAALYLGDYWSVQSDDYFLTFLLSNVFISLVISFFVVKKFRRDYFSLNWNNKMLIFYSLLPFLIVLTFGYLFSVN